MPRTSRMVVKGEKTVYRVMSRTCLDKFPFEDVDKDEMIKIIKRFSSLYFTEVFGFCIMGNHFHLLVRMIPDHYYKDDEIKKRYKQFNAETKKNNPDKTQRPDLSSKEIDHLRKKLSSLSEYLKEIKQTFSRYYNKLHNRRGTLWGERFKSVIVEDGDTLINCLAYIDLNPIRAGLVKRPEEYRWCSLGYHVQTDNKDNFLFFDFGLKAFNIRGKKERIKRYRRYVYEAGAIKHPEKCGATIDEDILESEREKNFDINRINRFRHRTRYFVDSGIIGSKAFVYSNYLRFQHMFQSKDKKPKPVKGISGMYSLKRLPEGTAS